MRPVHLAVLMTSHDRRARTLSALRALEEQRGLPAGTTLGVHLVDTGSTDGTPEAVRLRHPAVEVMSVGADVARAQALRIASRNSRSGGGGRRRGRVGAGRPEPRVDASVVARRPGRTVPSGPGEPAGHGAGGRAAHGRRGRGAQRVRGHGVLRSPGPVPDPGRTRRAPRGALRHVRRAGGAGVPGGVRPGRGPRQGLPPPDGRLRPRQTRAPGRGERAGRPGPCRRVRGRPMRSRLPGAGDRRPGGAAPGDVRRGTAAPPVVGVLPAAHLALGAVPDGLAVRAGPRPRHSAYCGAEDGPEGFSSGRPPPRRSRRGCRWAGAGR